MNLIKHANYTKFTRSHIVLLDANRKLIEVVLSIKALSFKLDAYFIVGFRQKPTSREVAVYIRRMEGYVITAHSEGFARKLVGLDSCENVLVEDVMPGLTHYLDTYGLNHPFVYRGKHVMITETSIGASPISMLYFCNTTNSLADFVQAGLISEEAISSLIGYLQCSPQRSHYSPNKLGSNSSSLQHRASRRMHSLSLYRVASPYSLNRPPVCLIIPPRRQALSSRISIFR
jgi:hypothetical protein